MKTLSQNPDIFNGQLLPSHADNLKKYGLCAESIIVAKIKSITPESVKNLTGFEDPHLNSAYQIPYDDNFSRFRLFYSDVEAVEVYKPDYVSTIPQTRRLYIPNELTAELLKNAKENLYIAVGEHNALLATQEGFPCVGIDSPWGWKNETDDNLIADFWRITLKSRKVFIINEVAKLVLCAVSSFYIYCNVL